MPDDHDDKVYWLESDRIGSDDIPFHCYESLTAISIPIPIPNQEHVLSIHPIIVNQLTYTKSYQVNVYQHKRA